ncbi:hypothetical protein Fmac_027109 [Flemingia macrophylla]|uniref:Uncharacterized protein n=1 Tax=Flemingia macrophylla TaxID=520843 RepID=A0ABD1LIF5_9FABA
MTRHESENEVSSDSELSIHDYNELHDAFCELYKEAKRMKNLNKVLKKNIAELEEELSVLKGNFERIKTENDSLKQPCMNCIELTSALRKNHRNRFVVERAHTHNAVTCSYCLKTGHGYHNCMIRTKGIPYGHYVWIKKNSIVFANKGWTQKDLGTKNKLKFLCRCA